MRLGGAGNGHIKSPSMTFPFTVFGVTVLPRLTSSKTLRRVFNRDTDRNDFKNRYDLLRGYLSIRIS